MVLFWAIDLRLWLWKWWLGSFLRVLSGVGLGSLVGSTLYFFSGVPGVYTVYYVVRGVLKFIHILNINLFVEYITSFLTS